MEGWWCVRYGDALACVEAPSAAAALRRSLDLHRLGDWTDDPRRLRVFPQDAYPEHAGSHDYTRAVLNAEPPPPERRRARSRGTGLSLALSCYRRCEIVGERSVRKCSYRGVRKGRSWAVRPRRRRFFNRMRKKIP